MVVTWNENYLRWTADGQRIVIIYEDGAVIVGSVDGNRLWGKELEHELSLVEWSPDGRLLLFATAGGEIHVYDCNGNYLMRLPIFAVPPGTGARVVGLQWYNGIQGYVEQGVPSLAIVYDNGKVQIMRDESDDNPILIDTGLHATRARWNTNGSVLAIAGVRVSPSGGASESQVQFYDPWAKFLRTLRVPGSGVTGLSWEGGSLRLALASDSYIYFANVRPDYAYGYFDNTLVYSFSKPERPEHCVCFWDTTTDERHIKG